MKVLIAEDDPVSRRMLSATLEHNGYQVVLAADGAQAWEVLQSEGAPRLAILDWMMPGSDGVEICRRVREQAADAPPYLILLTARSGKEDVIAGLDAGADDYLTKPFDRAELCARVRVGTKVLELQSSLAAQVRELEAALSQIKRLEGLLPICSYCKKIRDEQNLWHQVESFIGDHAPVVFSHSICPGCYAEVVQPQLDLIVDREKQ